MKKSKKIWTVLIILVLSFSATFLMTELKVFDWLEKKSYDNRTIRTSNFFSASEDIAVILIDQESLDWAKQKFGWGWPWPREAYGEIIDYLAEGNAASLAFDMVFTEPSLYGPEDDQKFADSCRNFGHVVQTVYYAKDSNIPLLPVDCISQSAAVLGNVNWVPDKDDVVRRGRFYADSPSSEPGLSVASLFAADKQFEEEKIPKAENGGMYIRYLQDLSSYAPYNAQQILYSKAQYEASKDNPESLEDDEYYIPPENFENLHIFFGLYAPGLFDICATPISATYPGVGVHISMLNTILSGDFIKDSPYFLTIILIFIAAAFGTFIGIDFKGGKYMSILLKVMHIVLMELLYIFFCYLFFIKGIILPFMPVIFSISLSFIISAFRSYMIEGKQKRFINNVFKQYLSPEVVQVLIEKGEKPELGGQSKNLTALFSDVKTFSGFTEVINTQEGEEKGADKLVQILNGYLGALSNSILECKGTIDKYVGDEIVSFFGAPLNDEDNAYNACIASIKMLEAEARYNEEHKNILPINPKTGEIFWLRSRVGLNTGPMVVGNMGTEKKLNYTIMGNNVNLASRLEGTNKVYGSWIMCSDSTWKEANKTEHTEILVARNLDFVKVVNVEKPVQIYNILGTKNNLSKERIESAEIFNEGMKWYLKNAENPDSEKNLQYFMKAMELFKQAKKCYSEDISSDVFIKRCNDFIHLGISSKWDGVYTMKSK